MELSPYQLYEYLGNCWCCSLQGSDLALQVLWESCPEGQPKEGDKIRDVAQG